MQIFLGILPIVCQQIFLIYFIFAKMSHNITMDSWDVPFSFYHHSVWCYCSCYWISPVRRFQLSKVCRKLLFCFLPISTAQQMLSHQQQLNKQSLASDRKLLFLKVKKRQIWLQIRPKKHNLYMRTSYKRKLIQRRKVLKGETSDIY